MKPILSWVSRHSVHHVYLWFGKSGHMCFQGLASWKEDQHLINSSFLSVICLPETPATSHVVYGLGAPLEMENGVPFTHPASVLCPHTDVILNKWVSLILSQVTLCGVKSKKPSLSLQALISVRRAGGPINHPDRWIKCLSRNVHGVFVSVERKKLLTGPSSRKGVESWEGLILPALMDAQKIIRWDGA